MDNKGGNKKNNAKKYIIAGACVILALLIILCVIAFILGNIANSYKEIPELDYDFYDPVYDLDINDYPEYLARDRALYYINEVSMKKAVTSENYGSMGDGPKFFYQYINAIKDGDSDSYNSLFDDEYISHHGEKEDFTRQMIYDIELKYLKKTEIDDSTDAITYSLEYCIYRNDGTFRRDIGSGYRTQYITVYFDLSTGDARIHSLQTEYNIIK